MTTHFPRSLTGRLTDSLSHAFAENINLTRQEQIYVQALYDSYHDLDIAVGRKSKYRYAHSVQDDSVLCCIAMCDERNASYFKSMLSHHARSETDYQMMFVTVCDDALHSDRDLKTESYKQQFQDMLRPVAAYGYGEKSASVLSRIIDSLADQVRREKPLIPKMC